MSYLVQLCVHYKEGVLNPEAQAIQNSTASLGYDIGELLWGRYCAYVSHQKTKAEAEREARELCDQLFANPVMETYEILSIKRQRASQEKI